MWLTPKTDWMISYDADGNYVGDYFSASDYQRIRGNLAYLAELAETLFAAVDLPNIPSVTVASYGYASTINALERSLDAIRDATVNPGIGETKTWVGNNASPMYTDLNRIESATLMFYDIFQLAQTVLPKLEYQMGGSEF